MTRPTTRDEDGMSLVELIVAVSVAALVLGLIASVFVNGFTAQREGVARDAATGAANVVASSVSTSVRNSTAIRTNAAGTRLDATYIAADGTPECRAWELRGNALVYRASKTGALPAADATWGKLATGVVGRLAAGKIFAVQNASSLQMSMDVTVDGITVALADGVVAQGVSTGGLAC